MNKQELLEKIKNLSYTLTWNTPRINKEIVIDLIEQLDEPQKPVVPQFVADYIEESRVKGWDLLASMCFVLNAKNKKTTKWFYLGENKNIFARAWMDGFEVEKEKRYLVKAMNIYSSSSMLKRDDITGEWFFGSEAQMFASSMIHTRKQLEQAGFGWVFDCEGVEVEEVEE